MQATQRLVAGLFECQELRTTNSKVSPIPCHLYRVAKESEAQSRFEVAVQAGLTPLVGREEELALLRRRWAQAQDGDGQVVLLSGEPGIGKSRLVQEFKMRSLKREPCALSFGVHLMTRKVPCIRSSTTCSGSLQCAREETTSGQARQTPARTLPLSLSAG